MVRVNECHCLHTHGSQPQAAAVVVSSFFLCCSCEYRESQNISSLSTFDSCCGVPLIIFTVDLKRISARELIGFCINHGKLHTHIVNMCVYYKIKKKKNHSESQEGIQGRATKKYHMEK